MNYTLKFPKYLGITRKSLVTSDGVGTQEFPPVPNNSSLQQEKEQACTLTNLILIMNTTQNDKPCGHDYHDHNDRSDFPVLFQAHNFLLSKSIKFP